MRHEIRGRGYLLAERFDTRRFEQGRPLATAPLAIEIESSGVAVLFRYGALVLFGVSGESEQAFLSSLVPHLSDPLPMPEIEAIHLEISPEEDDDVDASGMIRLKERSPTRLQAVADIIAKSLVLAHYEARIAAAFDRIEPLADTLRLEGRTAFRGKDLLRQMGEVLLTQHKMVGRVEVLEKPEVLWEHPELERLYARLEVEYELRERARALERKFDLISKTSEMLMGLLQSKRSLNIERYVVILIAAEILLSIYTIIAAPGALH